MVNKPISLDKILLIIKMSNGPYGHRAIASKAGVSLGTVKNYIQRYEDLVIPLNGDSG